MDGFGEDVATAYRDAALAHWRNYTPGVRSEGADTSSIPPSVTFGLAGLAVEAVEREEFPAHLSPSELRLALRYIVWELNGFPDWLESVYRVLPRAVLDAVKTELFWELAHAESGEPIHYVLYDVAAYAPWLHDALAEPLFGLAPDQRPTE